MNAAAFRHLYNYHLAENRKIWDICVNQLSAAQFMQKVNYSHGSVRDQIVHLINADDIWFSELRGVDPTEPPLSVDVDDRAYIHTYWDQVQKNMRAYLAALRDDMLFETPIEEPDEDRDLIVWQVLLHVANHATDHRAQILRSLNDLGVKTASQDYIFYVYDHPMPAANEDTLNKSELLQWLQQEYQLWQAFLAEIGPERMDQPGVNGDWSMKDIVAHLTGWLPKLINGLRAAHRGEPEPPLPWPAHLDDEDDINAWIYASNRERPVREVLDESQHQFQRLLQVIEELPDDVRIERVEPAYYLVWIGDKRFLTTEFFDHFRDDHEPDVAPG
ncbi:MAG: DinB family protein [Caldilineaceae bacterium]